ncbi:tRNA preQ1(34) S-adenosylmethionine ribosyltransferase-isomerase QueA [Geobacter pickeringii]|uniref:S-adenosylmethionine:tRNA ribosyltransferase-isomerase n=1 Tax=Geobacter pickeringii TaxID=345632 RepID=A0A0B5BEU7_9BACT|nr:tRNA preQ1(34) S-adenosylmethionine ribosyltransferase-isomerase QueA [Geobacter pickeringii]AJE02591.1 S-adenosylmethionine:tRNA ribosyltransferase-isomerase [Geobacter pickeringii]
MLVDDFAYPLPPELVAQEPLPRRDATRLMTVDRARGEIGERPFREIAALFAPGDLLVVNDTRVIPARLHGRKESGGKVEIFLVRRLPAEGERWLCLLRSSKPSRPGTVVSLAEGVTATVVSRVDGDTWEVAFSPDEGFDAWLDRVGAMPLPPYIRRESGDYDRERYQTVFACNRGAVAAPTAGLHMTDDLLAELRGGGVEVAPLTLHVGLGTFMPIRVKSIEEHRMHRERYAIPESTARAVAERKRNGGRVVALGTTVCRTLEQAAAADGTVPAGEGEAGIFIYPGYRFKTVDALITNFHLPKSTLLMLVSAFAGKELLFRAYGEAVARRFRFFSYGDAMFVS